MARWEDSDGEPKPIFVRLAIAIGVFVWLVQLMVVAVCHCKTLHFERSGQLGDSFGTLNCLFTGIAAVAAFAAFKSQQHDTRQTKDHRRRDNFRDGFHLLLEHWRGMVARIRIDEMDPHTIPATKVDVRESVDAIMLAENEFLGKLDHLQHRFSAGPDDTGWVPRYTETFLLGRREFNDSKTGFKILDLSVIKEDFSRFHEVRAGGQLGHYFRVLKELLQRITDATTVYGFSKAEVEELSRSFRVLLSDPELHLLLYWGLSERSCMNSFLQIDRLFLLEGLVEKSAASIMLRIPELAYYPETYKNWISRNPHSEIEGADALRPIYFQHAIHQSRTSH